MQYVLSLILVLSSGNVHADATPVVTRDEVLWAAVKDLRDHYFEYNLGHRFVPAMAVSLMASSAIWLAGYSARVPDRMRSLARVVGPGGMIVSEIYGFAALFSISKRRTGRLIPPSVDRYAEIIRELQIEGEYIRPLQAFLKRPMREQYQMAAADPGLREFIVQLDEWMRAGVTTQTPPLQPDGIVAPE